MAGFDDSLVREFFEVNGFFVRQSYKAAVAGKRKRTETEGAVFFLHGDAAAAVLTSDEAAGAIEGVAVGLVAAHGERRACADRDGREARRHREGGSDVDEARARSVVARGERDGACAADGLVRGLRGRQRDRRASRNRRVQE